MLKTTITLLTCGLSTLAFAGPGHSDDHGHGETPSFAAGQPGQEHDVDRVIRVEASDQMEFSPGDWHIQPGTTVRFVVNNTGQMPHEFVLDTVEGNADHREAMMEAMADGGMMEHNDPNAVTVEPGETGELVWTFTDKGTFEAACNIPGHYQAGMRAEVDVTEDTLAQND